MRCRDAWRRTSASARRSRCSIGRWPISSPRRDRDPPVSERGGTLMPVQVRIPTPLRSLTGGQGEVEAKADTVNDLVEDLGRQFTGLRERLLDDSGELRRFINVYVNEEDIRFLEGK